MSKAFKDQNLEVTRPRLITPGMSHAVYLADHVTGLNKNLQNLVQSFSPFLDERVRSNESSRFIAASLQHTLHWALSLAADLQDEVQREVQRITKEVPRHG
jgi:hypothetical protein